MLAVGIRRHTPDSLPSLDALEAVVAALATTVPASATAVVRVRTLIDAHERRSVARAAVALEAPHGLASGMGGSGGDNSGGTVCFSRWHAAELFEV